MPGQKPRYGRIILGVVIPLSICYGLLSPTIAAPLYNKLLFYPDYPVRYEKERYRVDSLEGVPKTDLHIPSINGAKLHAWFFKHPKSKYVVVVSHGNAGNLSDRDALAVDILKLGFSVLLYDYQGYGLSEGAPSIKNVCDDGVAVYDYLHSQFHYDGDHIILYGESLGCAVACYTSSIRPSCGLVLESGFSSLKQISSEKFVIFKAYPSFMFPRPNLDNVAILKQKHPPLLLIHGGQDTTVPPSHSVYLYEAASKPKQLVILPNSGHYVAEEDNPRFMEALGRFFSQLQKVSNENASAEAGTYHS